jgi:tetratricopeptide (TPR) repeat protein
MRLVLGLSLGLVLSLECGWKVPAACATDNGSAAADTSMVPLLPESVPTALFIAGAMIEGGDFEGALEQYGFALRHDPKNQEILDRTVALALRMGRLKDALAAVNMGLYVSKGDRDLRVQKTRLLLLGGLTDQAFPLSEELGREFPDDPEILSLRVEVLQRLGRLKDAVALQSKRLEENPDDPQLLRSRAALLLRAGSEEEGETILKDLLAKDPQDEASAQILVNQYRTDGQADQAITLLEKLLDQNPDGETYRRLLADLYLGQGRNSDACDMLMPLARDGSLDRHGQILLTDLLIRQERYDDAWELAQGLLTENEQDGLVLQMVGEIALERGELSTAEETLRRALQVRPDDPGILVSLLLAMSRHYPDLSGGHPDANKHQRASDTKIQERFNRLLVAAQGNVQAKSFRQNLILGSLLRRAGRSSEAVIPLGCAAALQEDNVQALNELAWAQESAGLYHAACKTLDGLLKLRPHEANLLNFYGYLLADQGWELKRAQSMIEEAVQAEPKNPYYLDSLGWVLYRQGHYEEALAKLIDSANLIGDDLTVLLHMGEVLLSLQRYDEARGVLERALALGGDKVVLGPLIERAKSGGSDAH